MFGCSRVLQTVLACLVLVLQVLAPARALTADVWFSQGRPNKLAVQAVHQLQDAGADGLDPRDYLADKLARDQVELQLANPVDSSQAQRFGEQLTLAMLQYLNDLAQGRVSAREVHHRFDGVKPRQFDANEQLRLAIEQGEIEQAVLIARPQFPLYPALRSVLSHYRELAKRPDWQTTLQLPASKKLELGQTYPQMQQLRDRLRILGDLSESIVQADVVYSEADMQAIRQFQRRHGLEPDGIIGSRTLAALNVSPQKRVEQIALSMERLRWTPLHQGDRLIAVNLPGFMLYAYEFNDQGGVDIKVEMRVVIGQSLNHRTPIFDENMRFIEFSPYWNVPASIARAEMVPALKKNPNYLKSHNMEFVDLSGRVSTVVSEASIKAVLSGQLRIRQRPGPDNALGSIKFIFPNNDNIYMHHTPATHLFAKDRRDFSHGCIRLEKPLELAKFVLSDEPQWTEAKILQAMDAGESKTVRLRTPVPVLIGYSTVLTRNGTVFFYSDVYGHDQTLRKALNKYRGLQ